MTAQCSPNTGDLQCNNEDEKLSSAVNIISFMKLRITKVQFRRKRVDD
jgi:hypothetical protein